MSTYKQNIKAKLEKESHNSQEAMILFFDRNKSDEQRLSAFKKFGTFNLESDTSKALSILRDDNESSEIRSCAILGLISYATSNEEFINELINFLKDNDIQNEIKEAALTVLQANTFSSPILSSNRPSYNNALKNLVEADTKQEIKDRAIEYLALEKDDYIQQKLLKGLENPEFELVKPEVAIQLLSYDLHSDAYPVLRKIAENPPNSRAKKEALRNLSTDPESTKLLIKTLNDLNEDEEIRHVCAVGLESLEPNLLLDNIKEILMNTDESSELQVALLNTLNYIPNTENIDSDSNFQSMLENFTNKSLSEKLKNTYGVYSNNKLKK